MSCETKYCHNKALPRRTKCATCRSREYKQNHPFRYFYNLSKQKARQRCIPWKLSFEEYKEVWTESGKWPDKIKGIGNWSMDRVDVNKGYEINNVRIIPISLNVDVWWAENRWQVDFRWRQMWSDRNDKPIEDCPF